MAGRGSHLQDQEEADWIRQAQGGDREAFAQLVRRYWGRIFRWLHVLCGCAHLAEDVTQDVFIKAWQALPGYKDAYFRAWLFRIARNALTDRQRNAAVEKLTTLPSDVSSKQHEPLEQLEAREFQASVDEACSKLPEIVRTAFLLWVQEEMPY